MADALDLIKDLLDDNWDAEQYTEGHSSIWSDVSSGTTTCTPSDDSSTYTEGSESIKLAIAEDGTNAGVAKCNPSSTTDVSAYLALGLKVKLSKDLTAWASNYPQIYLHSAADDYDYYKLNTDIRAIDATSTSWQTVVVDLTLDADGTNGSYDNEAWDYLTLNFATDDVNDTYDVYIDNLRFYYPTRIDYSHELKRVKAGKGLIKLYKSSTAFSRADIQLNYRDSAEVITVDIMTERSWAHLKKLYENFLSIIDDNRKDPTSNFHTLDVLRYNDFPDVKFWRRAVDVEVGAYCKQIT